jgi:uncharacterized lipoprotein
MQRSFVSVHVFSVVLALSACSKEEPEGSAEKLGKKIDEAVEFAQEQTSGAVESAQRQVAETKSTLGTAMEEKGKKMQEKAEESTQ